MMIIQTLRTWLPRLFLGLAAAILLWYLGRSAWLFARYNQKVISFPYPVDYGEGPILDQALRLAHFENIYQTDLSQPPFTIANYPPLYPLVQVPLVWIAGPAFWYGRLISLLSVLSAAVFIGLTLHWLTKDPLAALAGALLLPALPYILHWSPFCRVDSLALGLSWAGLYVIVRWSPQRRPLLTGALLLTAAVYTRQSYALAAPLAAFTWLLYSPPRRRAFELAALVAGFGLGLLLILNLATRGGFYFNIVTANVNPFIWDTVKDYAEKIWGKIPYLVVSSAFFVLVALWLRNRAWWLAAPYLVGGALSAITIGKDGSNVNYLYELCAGLSIVAGALLAWPARRWWLKILLLLALAWQVNQLYDWTQKDYYFWVTLRVTRERTAISRLNEIVRDAGGSVLADEFMGLIPLAGQPLVFQPFEFKQLVMAGVWDQQPFLDAIERQEFAAILLYDPPTWDSRHARWTDEQLHAIETNYRRTGRYADTSIYTPQKPGK